MTVVVDMWGPVCNLCNEEIPIKYICNLAYTKEGKQWYIYHNSGLCCPPSLEQLELDLRYNNTNMKKKNMVMMVKNFLSKLKNFFI